MASLKWCIFIIVISLIYNVKCKPIHKTKELFFGLSDGTELQKKVFRLPHVCTKMSKHLKTVRKTPHRAITKFVNSTTKGPVFLRSNRRNYKKKTTNLWESKEIDMSRILIIESPYKLDPFVVPLIERSLTTKSYTVDAIHNVTKDNLLKRLVIVDPYVLTIVSLGMVIFSFGMNILRIKYC